MAWKTGLSSGGPNHCVVNHDSGAHIFPERDRQLSRQRHDRRVAPTTAATFHSVLEPESERPWPMAYPKPGELNHRCPQSRVARLRDALLAIDRPALPRRRGKAGISGRPVGGYRSVWRVPQTRGPKRTPAQCYGQDTFYVGNMKGVGRIYQQTFIDTYAKVAFAKLYDRKTPITAADLLNDRVVPFYDAREVKLIRVLTDRGTEYCGNPEHHEYELYLALEDVDHSRTKTKSPQTNGIVERFHKTVLDEFYRVVFRKKIYGSIAELQGDLDSWVQSYNEERAHQGRWCFGKTPMQTFLDATPLAKEKMIAA